MLEVRLLGKFEVRVDGQPAEISLRAAQSLLAYLMLNAGTPHRREQLAGLFWPDMTDANARHNLRQALSRLRKTIGEQYISADDLTIAFDATSNYWLDVQVLTRAVKAQTSPEDLIDAVSVYDGELLPGFYDEWVSLERERVQAAFEQKMSLLLDLLIEAKRWDDVLQWGERWVTLGRSREAASRALITAHGARGDASQAVAVYQRCEEALRRDLGVEPSPQTRAALEQAKRKADAAIELLSQRPRTNLPAALTSFIGREKEIAEVQRLITTQRAVTLTGSGGAGKTRLAIQSARDLVDHFADGIWLIEFASLNDATRVPHEAASTLGLVTTSGRPLVTALIDVLREKHRLLIFDNCEHLIEACAQLATAVLPACPQVHILATSREPLEIQGEITYRVPPLSLPDAQQLPSAPALADYEAIRLFVERGTTALPTYTLTADNAAAIARICQRLDGMPLAIELAAARLKTLRAEEIATRLDDRFQLLTGGNRAALPRHQTLRATIEWSYNLLSEAERVLLQRLSVFAGGWTLEAAESVCGDAVLLSLIGRGVGGEGHAVLDLLTHLADKSLINIDRAQGQETRYGMLETIRQYAHEKLIESGEEAALRQRHLDYYVQLAEYAEPELVGPDQFMWFDRLETEFDNIRMALDWSLTSDTGTGLRLASALRQFWSDGMHANEGREGLTRLLQLPASPQAIPSTIRAKALAVQAELLRLHSEMFFAQQLAEESLTLYGAAGDEQGETQARLILGKTLDSLGQYPEGRQLHDQNLAVNRVRNDQVRVAQILCARAHFARHGQYRVELLEEARAIFRAHGHWVGVSHALRELAQEMMFQGNFVLARRQLNESIDLTRRVAGLAGLSAQQVQISGFLALREGDYIRAQTELEESFRLLQDAGLSIFAYWSLTLLGYNALRQGDWQRARRVWEQSLPHFRDSNDLIGVIFIVEGFASLAVQQQRPARAVRLFAWTDAMREAPEGPRPPIEQADVDRDLAVIHAQLDDATFEAEQQAGRQMSMDEAIAYALEEQGEDDSPTNPLPTI